MRKKGIDYLENNLTKRKIKYSKKDLKQLNFNNQLLYIDGTHFLNSQCINYDLHKFSLEKENFSSPYSSHLSNKLYQDLRYGKLPRVLRINDRLSMANGIELRVPFLDHRIVEFAFQVPNKFKIDYENGKCLIRNAMKNIIPEKIRITPKRHVVTPQHEWLRKNLRSNVEDLINDKKFKERGYF